MFMCVLLWVCVWGQRTTFGSSGSTRDLMQIIRLGNKHLCLLSHLAGPLSLLLKSFCIFLCFVSWFLTCKIGKMHVVQWEALKGDNEAEAAVYLGEHCCNGCTLQQLWWAVASYFSSCFIDEKIGMCFIPVMHQLGGRWGLELGSKIWYLDWWDLFIVKQ